MSTAARGPRRDIIVTAGASSLDECLEWTSTKKELGAGAELGGAGGRGPSPPSPTAMTRNNTAPSTITKMVSKKVGLEV